MNRYKGLIAAPFLPMHKGGEPDYDRIPLYYSLLKKNGIVGAFINGSTGEGVSLRRDERIKVAESWAKASEDNSIRIINLVGGTSYTESIDIALHSKTIGVDAIALLAPYYFKPSGAEELVDFCARIAESVPDMPVYFYHIPVLTGCNIAMYDFLKYADRAIPNLAGIKYTYEDFMDFMSCMSLGDGKYEMLWGRDESLLSALVLGTRGAVGSTYNYAAPLYNKLIQAFDDGDLELARHLQNKSVNMIRLLGKYGGIGAGKSYMKYIGFDCGEFRSPISNMSSIDYKNFSDEVKKQGLSEYFSER